MYKIGILGAGLIAKSHANAIKMQNNAKLIAVTDVVETVSKSFAKEYGCNYYTDCEEMLKKADIDIVIICLPTYLHEKYITLCISHGKHVLCEKPIEMSIQSTKQILNKLSTSNSIYMTAQVIRFWTGYTMIKKLYESGKLGNIYMIFASRCSQGPGRAKWNIDPLKGGGAIHDMQVHDIDFLRYLLGPMDYVYCHANKDYTGCWNHVMSSIAFKSGEKAVVEASYTMSEGYPFTMQLKAVGTKGTVEFYYKAKSISNKAGFNVGIKDSSISEIKIYLKDKKPLIIQPEMYDAYDCQLAYFLDCIKDNKQPEIITPNESLEVIEAITALKKSAETNKVIFL